MKGRTARSGTKGSAARPKNGHTQRRDRAAGEVKLSRPPSRAVMMRLAAEGDALPSQLAASRERISELETRIDIDPLTDVLNRRGFERELRRSLAYVKRYGT